MITNRIVRGSIAAIVLLLLVKSSVLAKVKTIPLLKFVMNSDVIIVGKVVAIMETEETYVDLRNESHNYQKATIKVEEVVAGNPETMNIEVYFDPYTSVDPNFQVGERYLAFLVKREGKWRIFNGYAGNLHLEKGDRIRFIDMADQEEEQDFSTFMRKVKEVLKEK